MIAASQAAYSVQPGYPIGNTGLATAAVTSQHQNILRTPGNLGQISTYSKTINTPYSSVSKSDVRVSNPGFAAAYNPYVAHAAAAPLYNPYYARPAAVVASPYHHASVVAASPYHHGPVVAKAAVAPGLLGVAYSAAPVVSHMTYSNGLGINYAW